MRIPSWQSRALLILTVSAACTFDDPVSLVVQTTDLAIDGAATYTLIGVQSGRCVEVQGGSATPGARLIIATCGAARPQQRWRIEAMGSGVYRLRNVNSGLCMDVSGASTADGAPVIQWSCGSGANQQWSFADAGNGAQRMTARHSGKVLDVTGWATGDGTLLEQWTWNGGANQQFRPTIVAEARDAAVDQALARDAGAEAGGSGGTGGGKVFKSCRFHFGTTSSVAKTNPAMLPELDFFTPGWMGWSENFDMGYVCKDTNPGGILADKVPVIVAYVAAFYAKRHFGRCDCNVSTCGAGNDLCHFGAADILSNLSAIVDTYRRYAQGFAACYGTTRPIVFEMEPDWYQYTGSSQTTPMTKAQAGTIMGQFVDAVKEFLPNAVFSLDISPWVGNNGADNGAEWYSHFDLSKFKFINTSGGGTDAGSSRIRSSNQMTWAGVSQVTGKSILADTGYGANGSSAGPDSAWDLAANINARMADGVVSISQYNPPSNWGTTIANLRSQLRTPSTCP